MVAVGSSVITVVVVVVVVEVVEAQDAVAVVLELPDVAKSHLLQVLPQLLPLLLLFLLPKKTKTKLNPHAKPLRSVSRHGLHMNPEEIILFDNITVLIF